MSRTHAAVRPLALLAFAAVTLSASLAGIARGAAPRSGDAEPGRWEFMVSSGSLVPTGAQSRSLDRGGLSMAQLAYVLRPSLAIGASLGWTRSRDLDLGGRDRLDVFDLDLGLEARGSRWGDGRAVSLRPFTTCGLGARRYDHRHLPAPSAHETAAYFGAGGELGVRSLRVRLEAREHLTGFLPIGSGRSDEARGDLGLLLGLRWVTR